jgi:hypothetical protein
VIKSPIYATGVGHAHYGARRMAPGPAWSESVPGQGLGSWYRRLM